MYYVDDVMTCWRHVPSTGARAQLYAKSQRLLNIFFLLLLLLLFFSCRPPRLISLLVPSADSRWPPGRSIRKKNKKTNPPKKNIWKEKKNRQTLRRAVTGERHIIIVPKGRARALSVYPSCETRWTVVLYV
jgi:hypothetical protein